MLSSHHRDTLTLRSSWSNGFRGFFVIGGLLVAFLLSWLIFHTDTKIILANKNLLAVPWPSELEFAGEAVPLDNFYVREDWEKEFLVNLGEDYQNLLYLKRTAKYFPLIESELATRGLPSDLKYLAVAESGLREEATSSAAAAGIWQFVPATGTRYGLRIDEFVDERHHFAKSTKAALTYLEALHEKFGNWTLAAAGYNAGENGIARRLTEQSVGSYYDLYLNSETSRYLFRILAIKQILANPEDYGYELEEDDYFVWPETRQVAVTQIDNLSDWAHSQGSNLRSVKELNPWIMSDRLPQGNWVVLLPKKQE